MGDSEDTTLKKGKSSSKYIILFVVIVLLGSTFLVTTVPGRSILYQIKEYLPFYPLTTTTPTITITTPNITTTTITTSTSTTSTTTSTTSTTTTTSTATTSTPTTTTTGTQQPVHPELVYYALSLINNDRMEYGLPNVTLCEGVYAQHHADNMLVYDYFSHWDVQGLKPYIRFTILNGSGSVQENIAYYYNSGGINHREALEILEYEMMYNDAMHDWGHRDNILDPNHNKVCIGIAFDSTHIYLVQDFVNDYIDWEKPISLNQDGTVEMSGTLKDFDIYLITIFFDENLEHLTKEQLSSSRYQGSYNQGDYIGGVPPPGSKMQNGITINPSQWQISNDYFSIKFNLRKALVEGSGWYSVFLMYLDSEDKQVCMASKSFLINVTE